MPQVAENKAQTLRWKSLAIWCLASTLGWTVDWAPWPGGNTMLHHIAAATGLDPTPWPLLCLGGTAIITGLFTGIILGGGQALALRHPVERAGPWCVMTALGAIIGSSVSTLLGRLVIAEFRAARGAGLGDQLSYPLVVESAMQSAAIQMAATGLAIGFCQWLVLQSWIPRAWSWMVLSSATWAIAGAVYWFVYGLMQGPFCQSWLCLFDAPGAGYYPASIISWLVGGTLIGLTSWLAIKFLLFKPNNHLATISASTE